MRSYVIRHHMLYAIMLHASIFAYHGNVVCNCMLYTTECATAFSMPKLWYVVMLWFGMVWWELETSHHAQEAWQGEAWHTTANTGESFTGCFWSDQKSFAMCHSWNHYNPLDLTRARFVAKDETDRVIVRILTMLAGGRMNQVFDRW